MAIPWITLLANVPWKQVIEHTPSVVEGARKLWQSTQKREDAANRAAGASSAPVPADPASAALRQRLDTLEGLHAGLAGQMRAASDLVQSLAEQNAQLVLQVEALRRHQRRLTWLALAAAGLAMAAAWMAY